MRGPKSSKAALCTCIHLTTLESVPITTFFVALVVEEQPVTINGVIGFGSDDVTGEFIKAVRLSVQPSLSVCLSVNGVTAGEFI